MDPPLVSHIISREMFFNRIQAKVGHMKGSSYAPMQLVILKIVQAMTICDF